MNIFNYTILFIYCNAVCNIREEGDGNRRTFNTFNNKIKKHKWKAAAPHGRLPHTKHKLKFQAVGNSNHCCHSSFYSFRSSSVGLETGEWHRCRSLSFTPPASLRSHGSRPRPTRHIPPSPLAGRGVLPRLRSTPPLPPLPGGARQGGRGVPGGKDRRGERKETEGWGVTEKREGREKKKISVRFPDTLPLGPQPTERLTRGAMRWYWTSLVDGPMPLRLLAAGDGSSGRGQPAASPPFPAPPPTWRMAAGSGPLANGADSSAPSRMAATPPRPRSTAASLPSHLFFFCSSTTASGSHWRSPPLPAARSPQHRDPTQQRGLSDSVSLLHPGLRHQCNAVRNIREEGGGNRRTFNTFNNKIKKHKWKAAAPHGRLPHTKHKLKFQAWSSLIFHCCHSSFYSFRSSSVGLETGEWRRCRSLSFTPPASLRSHGSRPRPTRHIYI